MTLNSQNIPKILNTYLIYFLYRNNLSHSPCLNISHYTCCNARWFRSVDIVFHLRYNVFLKALWSWTNDGSSRNHQGIVGMGSLYIVRRSTPNCPLMLWNRILKILFPVSWKERKILLSISHSGGLNGFW